MSKQDSANPVIGMICLNMIVKDEAHIIRETLTHLMKHIPIGYWVIDDTGSTDGTQEIIRSVFREAGIAGELYETPWENFGFNRSKAMEHAYNKSDYLLVWDADDSIEGQLILPSRLTADHYLFAFGNESGFRYSRAQLFNNRKRWKYNGVLHEYPSCIDNAGPPELVPGNYYFISGKSGSRSRDPKKYQKDAAVLEKALIEEPDNARYAFYCANSYKDAGDIANAVRWYKKVFHMNGWGEEKYVSSLHIWDMEKKPENLHYLVEAHAQSPERVENILRLVRHYGINGNTKLGLLYYSLVSDFYENRYTPSKLSQKLFASSDDHDFFLPYFVIITALRAGKKDLVVKMFRRIFTLSCTRLEPWWYKCLFFNMQFVVADLPLDLEFLWSMIRFREALPFRLDPPGEKAIADVIDRHRPLLGAAPASTSAPLSLKNKTSPQIFLSITSCKRLDLFQKTMNSILNCWTDLDQVDYFLCVDDNSSATDRTAMKTQYPWFQFVMKGPDEKGHRASMNIIWSTLKTLKPRYWIHLDDDFLFFRKGSYVREAADFLDRQAKTQTQTQTQTPIHQLLWNRNYCELWDWDLNGGVAIRGEPGFIEHEKSDTIHGKNCGYWPHYSFRPSMVRVDPILTLGNFDSPNTFFERDYADRWYAAGYQIGRAHV